MAFNTTSPSVDVGHVSTCSEPSLGNAFPMRSAPTVTVVIPAMNEAENLPHVLPRIPSWMHEILLVDGHSTDGTAEVTLALCPKARIIAQEGQGKGAALRSGFAAATGDIVVLLDADGSTDPAEIPAFVGALLAGADFAKGSRFLQGGGTADMPPYRQFGNWLFVVLTNMVFGTRYTDITYGYNACWRRHATALALEIDGWACEIISNIRVARLGLRVTEVASFEHIRIAGQAKLATLSAGWAILKGIAREALTEWPPRRLGRETPLWQVRDLSTLSRQTPVWDLGTESSRQSSEVDGISLG